jgi:hypothetical protein
MYWASSIMKATVLDMAKSLSRKWSERGSGDVEGA